MDLDSTTYDRCGNLKLGTNTSTQIEIQLSTFKYFANSHIPFPRSDHWNERGCFGVI